MVCVESKVMDRFAQKEQRLLPFCRLFRSQGSPFPHCTDMSNEVLPEHGVFSEVLFLTG